MMLSWIDKEMAAVVIYIFFQTISEISIYNNDIVLNPQWLLASSYYSGYIVLFFMFCYK